MEIPYEHRRHAAWGVEKGLLVYDFDRTGVMLPDTLIAGWWEDENKPKDWTCG